MQQPPSGQNWPQQDPYGYGQPSQPLPPNTQYPPQQGQWQQPYGQPQGYPPVQLSLLKKKKSAKLFVLVAILVVIVGSFAAAFAIVSSQPRLPSGSSTALGKPLQIDGWIVTVNKVTTSNGDSANIPQSGDIYLAIDVKLQNVSSSVLIASSTVQFNLTDSTGQTYNQATTFEGSPNGELLEGGSQHGTLYYEVPRSIYQYTLRFIPSLFNGSDVAVWAVTLS